MTHPPSPWHLRGDLLLSVWRVGRQVTGAAFVDYRGDTLTYRELLVARPVLDRGRPAARITQIWVDSEQSLEGGRALWAIPKQLAVLRVTGDTGSVSVEGRSVATARFRRGRALPGRLPVRLWTAQPRGASTVVTPVRGRATVHLATARWDLAAEGPLGRLAGRRPLVSLVLADFDLRFGR